MLFAPSAKSKEGFQLTSDVDVESVPGFCLSSSLPAHFTCTSFLIYCQFLEDSKGILHLQSLAGQAQT